MTNNQLAENSIIQLLSSVKLARDNAERADNRVDHSFYYALTIALEELQERRKADTEHYGFTDGDRRGMIYKPEHADRLSEPVPVYRHAQQPVVDADDNFYSWFGREWQENYQHNQYTTAAKQMLGVMAESAWKAGRRAAMLQAGNSPVIQDTWIPVSERMPVEFEEVIAFDGDQVYGEAMYSSDDGFTIDGYDPCDRLNLQNVTHWMPLPAAPQEVKP